MSAEIRKIFVSFQNKVKFENGETVVASIWDDRGLVPMDIKSTQCFYPFRNGKPYIKIGDWTEEEKRIFMKK